MNAVITLSPRDDDAVLFDLDDVLTRTASVHASAWKKLFDRFLEQRAPHTGEPFVPLDIDADYPRYVDGKPRYDGVAAFLESRGIELPLGVPDDGPDVQSVCALGNLKDRYFLQHREQHGVERDEAGIEVRGDVLRLNPELPREMKRIDMRIRYRGHSLDLRLTRDSLTVRGRDGAAPPIATRVDGEICEFVRGSTRVFHLNDEATDGAIHRDATGDAP